MPDVLSGLIWVQTDKFNKTRERMLEFYLSNDIKITLKSHFWRTKVKILSLMWTSFHNVTKFCKLTSMTSSGLSILMHVVISLPNAAS